MVTVYTWVLKVFNMDKKKLVPQSSMSPGGDVDDVFFDLILIIDKDNNLTVIDDSQEDWTSLADGNTLAVKLVRISIG